MFAIRPSSFSGYSKKQLVFE